MQYDFMLLAESPSAREDFPAAFEALELLSEEMRFCPENSFGELHVDYADRCISQSRHIVVVASNRDVDFSNRDAPISTDSLINEVMSRILVGQHLSLVVVTDCPTLARVSPYLNRFFVKKVNPKRYGDCQKLKTAIQEAMDGT